MTDYWSKLKLNECWSEKERYNLILNLALGTENEVENEDTPQGDVEPIVDDGDDEPEDNGNDNTGKDDNGGEGE